MALVAPALESPRSPRAASSYGPLVVRWAERRLGVTLGDWQVYAVSRALECDSDEELIARYSLLSVGRQNGKSVIVRAIVGWILDEGYKLPAFREWKFILLAAHDAKQARIPYTFIRQDLENYADVDTWGHSARRAAHRARATMSSGIELHGITVDVASRHAGATRGVSPGLIAFDEVLTQTDFNMYDVLSPALSAVRNSQMMMTSTMGFADSVVLRAMYDRLYRQSTGAEQPDDTFMGLLWRADDDDVGLDWDQLKKSNPALDDGRLSRRMIAAEYAVLPRGSWVRERLNRWHDERVDAPFSLAAWGSCRVKEPLEPERLAYPQQYTIAVDVTSTWSEGSIIVASQRSDGKVGVEVHRYIQSRPETPVTADYFTQELTRLSARLRVEKIVYVATSPLAAAMERFAILSGIMCEAIQSSKVMAACQDFAESVISQRIAHDDPHLDSQMSGAQRRFVGTDGAWRWTISNVPCTSVVGATLSTVYAMRAVSPVQVFI